MKHLMIFAIGPVQDFIATARRSRDLWYGSWMLSELARTAAKAVKKHGKLIFPADTEIAGIPNKIMATVETENLKQFAEEVEDAVRDYLRKELTEKTLASIPLTEGNKALACRQIEDLPDIYWASTPYDNKAYDVVREEAEALLVARKTTRDFKQMLGANVPKSSLDGSRESVIDESEYPKKDNKDKEQKIRRLYDNYHARQGERLSGVDLLKRMGERDNEPDFRSTSHMAAIPFIEKLDKKWGKVKREEFIESIRQLFAERGWNIREEDDGALLYESRLTDWIPAGKEQDEIKKKFNEIWKESGLGDSRPSPYYALLRADGDNMGTVIDAQKEEGKHRELSKALSGFASKVSSIVTNKKENEADNKGLLIYSGGDDVLAYLPINKALRCAEELKEEFRKRLEVFFAIKKVSGKEIKITPTLSVGIVIAHHLDPLSDVLQLALEAEHKAKDDVKVPGKNGLAITLSKRSGIDRTVVDKFSELYKRLIKLIEFFEAELLSGGTAYELQELHRTLAGHIPDKGLAAEALRIAKHKKESGGGDLSQDVKDKFEEWIGKISPDELANEMIVAKALADTSQPIGIKEEANA